VIHDKGYKIYREWLRNNQTVNVRCNASLYQISKNTEIFTDGESSFEVLTKIVNVLVF